MNNQPLILGMIFFAVALGGYFAARLALNKSDGRLRGRLASNQPAPPPKAQAAPVSHLMQQIGQAAAKPFMPTDREKQSTLRRKLAFAGIYAPNASKAMSGFKGISMAVGAVGGYLVGLTLDNVLLGISLGGLLGYFVPKLWLDLQIKKNQSALNAALPDALDLMVVCVEAGLTVDAALQRVGQELTLAHPRLSRELSIAHMETRVGISRAESFKNLAVRTGNGAIQSLVALLNQADRFGTSIASALRIHSESIRNQRHSAAEEMAAKASVKMTFPLVLFIFPATFIVLAGPTVIGLMRSELFK